MVGSFNFTWDFMVGSFNFTWDFINSTVSRILHYSDGYSKSLYYTIFLINWLCIFWFFLHSITSTNQYLLKVFSLLQFSCAAADSGGLSWLVWQRLAWVWELCIYWIHYLWYEFLGHIEWRRWWALVSAFNASPSLPSDLLEVGVYLPRCDLWERR